MTDLVQMVALGLLPVGLLGLSSLSKSFRGVLRAVFTDSGSSTVITKHADGDVVATSDLSLFPSHRASAWPRHFVLASHGYGMLADRAVELKIARDIAAAVSDAKREDGEVVITIRGGHGDSLHSGKHSRGTLVTGHAE